MLKFTPEQKTADIQVPDFEDARADFAPYYSIDKSNTEGKLQGAVSAELAKLGGHVNAFLRGAFEDDGKKRYGYEIHFTLDGAPGVIRVAGLPIRAKETADKVSRVRRQALANVRDWLKTAVTAQVFSPGTNPLLPHLLLPDGSMTVGDYIARQNHLPLLDQRVRQEVTVEQS